jgi:hypothetical protein
MAVVALQIPQVLGLPNQKKPSIILLMSRGTSLSGTKKCRNFTRLVNFLQTTFVVSTALTPIYCALRQPTLGDSPSLNQSSV